MDEEAMPKPLTATDVKILEALCEAGPRNLSKIARNAGLPRKSVGFRLARLKENPQFFLRMHTSIYHTNLGLRKAVVVLEAEAGLEKRLFDCLLANDFWLYVCRSYGMGEGCTAIYAIPIERCREFEEFINETARLRLSKNIHLYWSTCFQGGRITSRWFDANKNQWAFNWDKWIDEIPNQETELPYTLIEPKAYPIYADETDVRMLEELEFDAAVPLNKVAETLGISPQVAHFHYKDHLIGKNLIEGYEVFLMRYGDSPCFMALFMLSFPSYETFARFAHSLLDQSFVITMGKMIGQNGLLAEVFLPISEFRNFVDALSKMTLSGLLSSYKYVIQDLRVRRRQTIFPRFFKENKWVYDYGKHLETLRLNAAESK